MAKTIEFQPLRREDLEDLDHDLIDDFIDLLRAVADGDEEAREMLRFLLELMDDIGLTKPKAAKKQKRKKSAKKDEAEEAVPLLLPRDHVRELHLRIKLNCPGIKIWRELKVPSNLSLRALGDVLQDAMGWEHARLFNFHTDKEYYILDAWKGDFIGYATCAAYVMEECTVDDLLAEKGRRAVFEYDLGDGWEHELWYKAEREYGQDEQPAVVFVKGQGACPPEHCGGFHGYQELLSLLGKPSPTPKDLERLDWYAMNDSFNPGEIRDKGKIVEKMDEWTRMIRQA